MPIQADKSANQRQHLLILFDAATYDILTARVHSLLLATNDVVLQWASHRVPATFRTRDVSTQEIL
jgi:hypothetical protein